MLSFKKFIIEGLVYGNEIKGSFTPRTPINQWDPHPHYETHYNNMMHLSFIHKNSKNPREKIQASKELDIANKKMKFWSSHPKFDNKKGLEIATRVKKRWNQNR
jgi:hypothetical protein